MAGKLETIGNQRKSRGFTLVELLVVITIIGILIGLLLPAVNSARESGRNTQCRNNLKQIGTACLAHEEAQGIYPTGGWGWYWVGDPDRGFGEQQPGGWLYNILPHTELNAIHDLGRYGDFNAKKAAILQMVTVALPMASCPTRRRPALYPMNWGTTLVANNAGGVNAPASYSVARTDYAVNVGDAAIDENSSGPSTGADWVYGAPQATINAAMSVQNSYFSGRTTGLGFFQSCHGICFERSTIRKDDVTDGLSDTLLAGEKYLGLNSYGTGKVGADNENLYVGFDNDIGRTTSVAPMQDRWGVDNTFAFGSAHPNSANFVKCDGSTCSVSYLVDPTTFAHFGTRNGGDTADLTKLGN